MESEPTTKDLMNYISDVVKEFDEKSIQQRSGHHSDLLRQIKELDKKIDDNTRMTQENTKMMSENTRVTTDLAKHPIFKAWNDGKTIAKIIKWGGYTLIGASAVLVAVKNGGSIIKEYLRLFLK